MSALGHRHSASVSQNHKAQLANAYNELGKELASQKIRVIGNYTLGKVIGEGAFGKVRMGTHRLTSTRVAIKQIPKAMSAVLTREIHHHRQLHHPHVTQMYEVIATESYIWIVTELCSGGELFDYLAEKGRLSEEETRIIFGQLCLAVAYLHDKGIVHRDLKLENVLLDERCRVKLGDFGFTREYEKGVYMETFCGTTGYAAPEVLQGKRYLGPEVDIWSIGVILYCLLTGTLPFDDDDETIMKQKVIKGEFEDPEWLSRDARDLLRDILQTDPSKRLTIPQILASPWFTPRNAIVSIVTTLEDNLPSPSPARTAFPLNVKPSAGEARNHETDQATSATSITSEGTFLSAISEFLPSAPATPDGVSDPFQDSSKSILVQIRSDPSQSTITKGDDGSTDTSVQQQHEATIEEERNKDSTEMARSVTPSNPARIPPHPTRTPARTKRRSVSSILSDGNGSPAIEIPLPPLPPQDFASLLNTPAPIIFSTPAERELLNTMSAMGFDTAQIVHSVISDACDSAGALWWMLMRKHEKRIFDEVRITSPDPVLEQVDDASGSKRRKEMEGARSSGTRKRSKRSIAVQTDDSSAMSAPPAFALVPPTPTVPSAVRPTTPPRAKSPFLSPSPTTNDSSVRSSPSTPSGSYKGMEAKDKDVLKLKRDAKARSGSVSIMQRATTALEAAGLVRKKSAEAVKDQREAQREKERSRENDKAQVGDDPRSSHGSASSSKLTKSPPVKAKDVMPSSSSPPPDLPAIPGSPWVMAGGRTSPPNAYAPTPANSPGDTLNSLPNFSENGGRVIAPSRHRASLLSAFRLWFQEDRKGKRKEATPSLPQGSARGLQYSRSMVAPPTTSTPPSSKSTVKRRTSGGGRGRRVKRQSVSSRRSSSVNSRRSSGNSAQIFMLEPSHTLDQIHSVRSFGADTPNSERGDYSSRPSSIHSVTLGGVPRHGKSPSTGSNGSAYYRNSSPLPKYNHRRAGSSSSTRVVRHIQSTPGSVRAAHHRSNSAASSAHSLSSSRPTSFYEPSEGEATRTGSPFKGYPSRRSLDENTPRRGAGTFIAQKRITPFTSPHYSGSLGRTSWKKSWGHEPPGWQNRSTHLPVEVLVISPAPDIRDVFSTGRPSLNMGDESDWVDEDEDVPEFAGGLGQMPGSATSSSTSSSYLTLEAPIPLVMSPPPRNHGGHSRTGKARTSSGAGVVGRRGGGHSPAGRSSPSPGQGEMSFEAPEARGGRWQLPAARGPAFKHPIQEEDEGEEE